MKRRSATFKVKDTPRASDEYVLRAIRMRCNGVTLRKIAERLGGSNALLCTMTERVREDDLYFSDEPEERVRRAYW